MTRPSGVFVDRDGTIIEDPGYLADPGGLRLIPGAAEAVAQLNAAGIPVVVVTNQSGIARGLYGWERYRAVKTRLDTLLARFGARLDATYVCPHHPSVTGPCTCRKPSPRLFTEAAEALRIDLAQAVWIGDRMSDVEPALAFGGTGLLVLTGEGARHAAEAERQRISTCPDLGSAVDSLLR
jgi:D-glycero-D-manno-heptose 1,7-bisphosphate phosphatase